MKIHISGLQFSPIYKQRGQIKLFSRALLLLRLYDLSSANFKSDWFNIPVRSLKIDFHPLSLEKINHIYHWKQICSDSKGKKSKFKSKYK